MVRQNNSLWCENTQVIVENQEMFANVVIKNNYGEFWDRERVLLVDFLGNGS